MALFLPILRLLMLFLNVYESYKTLKLPPPSSRNPARPSVRALTQRKRDMKGCLSVWIVWVSLALYERILESLVSLFIPFYDEFKSLALLFLIVTRARGAEPIYLHLIRPIIKPYTTTLDAALELMLMLGDFLIALSTYPVRLAVQWWRKHFARFFEPSSFEDSSDESSDEVSNSSSFFTSSGQRPITSARVRNSGNAIAHKNRHPHIPPGTHHKRGVSREDVPQEPDISTPESSTKRSSSSRSRTLPTADSNNGETDSSTSRHQIWYPPTASYPDNGIGAADIARTLRPLVSVEVKEQVTILAEQQTDEWRQYPPFPSAYPPTPIAATSRPGPNSLGLSPSIYPPIPEEVNSKQDFYRTLLPPRGPLNPSPTGDLSVHRYNPSGISPFLASDADESISSDGCGNEDEDVFNLTLKTPLQMNGSMRSRPYPSLLVLPRPISAVSSNFSVPSRSSTLATVDNSPLRTDTWSDSSLSSAAVNQLPASVIGKKRSHPRAAKGKAPIVEDHESSNSHERRSNTPYSQPRALERLTSLSPSDAADSIDITRSTSSLERNEDNDVREQIPKEKRRKVTKLLPLRTVNSPRPTRSKTSSISSPPRGRSHATTTSRKTRKSGGRQPIEMPASPAKRRSRRLKAGRVIEMEGTKNQGEIDSLSTESLVQEGATPVKKK